MPDVTTTTTRKILADGREVVYTFWRGSWTDGEGKRHTVNLGNIDHVAKAVAKKALIEAIGSRREPTAESLTVAEWTQRHIDQMNVAEITERQYKIARRQAIECWGEHKRLRDVTTEDVERLRDYIRDNPIIKGKETISDYTIRNRLESLGAMFARATVLPKKAKPYIRENPFDEADIPDPKGASVNRYVTVDERRQLIEAAPDKNFKALLALTGLMAMRLENALAVEVEHINWTKQAILVKKKGRDGKGDSTKQADRMVPMSAAALRIILDRYEELPEGSTLLIDRAPFFKGTRQKPADHLRRLMERAGVLNVVKPFHDLRKSQADDWAMLHGCNLSAKWCGHGVAVAEKHYRKAGDDDLALVTGLGDPKAKLKAEYEALDRSICPKN